jgi:hypothetical protein
MNLMLGESILLESPSGTLVLTSHRIRYEKKSLGQAELRSIMLEELSSCAMERTSLPIFLVLGALSLAFGVVAGVVAAGATENVVSAVIGITLGIAFVGLFSILFLITRRQVLSVASSAATITLDVSEMSVERARHFIDAIEAAKNVRYLLGRDLD